MLKKCAFVFFIISMIIPMADAEEINETDNSYLKEYFFNGILKAEGYWKFYYRNEGIQKEGHYSNDKPIKYWYFYDESGTLKSEGHFSKAGKNMWWLFYDDNERIRHKCQLKNNKKNGHSLEYSNEKLVKVGKYKDGKKINEWTDFRSYKKENKLSDLK